MMNFRYGVCRLSSSCNGILHFKVVQSLSLVLSLFADNTKWRLNVLKCTTLSHSSRACPLYVKTGVISNSKKSNCFSDVAKIFVTCMLGRSVEYRSDSSPNRGSVYAMGKPIASRAAYDSFSNLFGRVRSAHKLPNKAKIR